MTREEATEELKILKEDYWDDDGYGYETEKYNDTILALDMAIEALEQEPILDKIRTEILEEVVSHSGTGEEVIQAYADGLKKGLEILDKYSQKVRDKNV